MSSAVALMCRQAALTPLHIASTWTFTPPSPRFLLLPHSYSPLNIEKDVKLQWAFWTSQGHDTCQSASLHHSSSHQEVKDHWTYWLLTCGTDVCSHEVIWVPCSVLHQDHQGAPPGPPAVCLQSHQFCRWRSQLGALSHPEWAWPYLGLTPSGSDPICQWFTHFLKDRRQHVKLVKDVSDTRTITTGAPLISLYINCHQADEVCRWHHPPRTHFTQRWSACSLPSPQDLHSVACRLEALLSCTADSSPPSWTLWATWLGQEATVYSDQNLVPKEQLLLLFCWTVEH